MKSFPEPDIWLEHRVSYGETDAMAVLYYANYLHLFERARGAFIRSRGISYAKVEEQGIYLPVHSAECRYYSPARYDDLIHIHCGISEWGKASMVFVYEIHNESKERLLVKGSTKHAVVNHDWRTVQVPEWLRRLF